MARSARPVGSAEVLGIGAALLVAALIFGSLAAVLLRAGALALPGKGDWAAVRFTLLQAALSAALSVLLAIPMARALARRRFFGRRWFITLLGAPFILPVVVAVLGLLAVFGRNGLLNAAMQGLGLPSVQIYGLQGVLLAHVFFNLPLAVRLILQGWLAIPAERFRLAAALDFRPRDVWRHLERPMLVEMLPGVLLTIFLLCLTSFAVALTLGGGPAASTVELAIYQAFRYDYDLGRVATLGLLQLGISGSAVMIALRLVVPAATSGGIDRQVIRWDARTRGLRLLDGAVVAGIALFLLVPVGLVLARGLPAVAALPVGVWQAAARSVAVAVAAAGLAVTFGMALALAALRWGWLEGVGMLVLAASPIVIGAGLFLILFGRADPATLVLPITAAVNGLMALPLVLRALMPEARMAEAQFGRLADHLGMQGWPRIRLLLLPRLRRAIGFAGGLAAALAMGDLGVVALFADPAQATLPMQVYALMGAYRMEQAAGAAVLLTVLGFALFWACDRWGRHAAD